MTKYKQIQNPNSGETEFLFNATLLKIGKSVLENSNEKLFKVVTLKFNLPDGEEVESPIAVVPLDQVGGLHWPGEHMDISYTIHHGRHLYLQYSRKVANVKH